MSIISWNGTPGCCSPYSAVLSPRILSYEIFAKLTSGKLCNFPSVNSSPLIFFVVIGSNGKSVSRLYFVAVRTCLLRCLSVDIFICLARVDFPIPGSPTGTKKSLVMCCIDLGETRSTTNLNSACSICSSLHPKGTATSC